MKLKDTGQDGFYPAEGQPLNIMAHPTGEKRPPMKGEYYLSGAQVTACRAYNDLSDSYYIAELVQVKRTTKIERV